MDKPIIRWGALWRSNSRLNGKREHVMFKDYLPALFRTRREAREWIAREYGYIKTRKDLRSEPHGWRLPKPVRVALQLWEESGG